MTKNWLVAGGLMLVGALTACGGGDGDGAETEAAPAGAAAEATTGTDVAPDPGREVITVQMMTDADGSNRFEPAHFEARKGDVVRYVLVQGVHNVNFLPDSNAGKSGLPPAGPMLQLPQQTYDVKVTMDPGAHYFQCDPHAALGMVGHLTVKE